MTWVKLDDDFPEHPKVDRLSDAAFRLHVAGLCHSSRHLTDGYVGQERVSRLVPRFKPTQLMELTDAGLWEQADCGWQIHDYLLYQPSAEKVKAERDAAAQRMRTRRSGPRSAERSGEQTANVRPKFADPLPVPSPSTSKTPAFYLGDGASQNGHEPGWGKFEATGPHETNETRDRRRGLALRWQSVLAERGVKAGHRECNDVVAKALHIVDWKIVDETIGWFLESTVAPRSPKVLEAAVSKKAYR